MQPDLLERQLASGLPRLTGFECERKGRARDIASCSRRACDDGRETMRCDTQGPEELGVWKPRAGIPAKSEHCHCGKLARNPQQNICLGPFVRQYFCKEPAEQIWVMRREVVRLESRVEVGLEHQLSAAPGAVQYPRKFRVGYL